MTSVKIKTEPTAIAAAVDVQVKLEPSFSTGDIKLEQHTSDIDTKLEPDSDTDSEEVKSESDDDDDEDEEDTDQFTITPKKKRQFICEYNGCGRVFNSCSLLNKHQHEHRIQTQLNIFGKTYALTRQSLNDRWPCPVLDCISTAKTINATDRHIRSIHGDTMRQQQQPSAAMARHEYHFYSVDDFYMNGARYGYHNITGVFICHECKLVPECLLTHLQQKHGYNQKSIDNSVLPESRVNAGADPNGNQYTSNSHLASAINQPYQQHHQDIVQGWLCVTSDCGYCGYAAHNKSAHRTNMHKGEQFLTVPALVLRLRSSKTRTSSFLITRIDKASGAVTVSSNRVYQHKLDYNHSGLNAQDENEDDFDQNETTEASNQKREFICEYPNCGRSFNTTKSLSKHRREHKLEVVVNVFGNTFTLSRRSLDNRWPCPVSGCDKTCKGIEGTRVHIEGAHITSMKQKRANMEVDNNQRQEQQIIKRREYTIRYLDMDDFYVNGVRCGYHTTAELFVCHECRLVPECLLTHLQQKHGFDEKSIDNSALPESVRITKSDPNGNQHTTNPHLSSAISQPCQHQHQDIIQGKLCVVFDCGYCYYTKESGKMHQYTEHRGEQESADPALILRLLYGKLQTSSYFITRLDTATAVSDMPNSSTSQNKIECDDDDEEDDGDELVLSDYSD